MYFLGHGVQRDFAEGMKWHQKSAAQNDPVGICNMGAIPFSLGCWSRPGMFPFADLCML